MLINKAISAGSIVCFKITNGDEIVAKIASETADGWTLNRPCTLIPSPQGIGLMQCMIAADTDADVPLSRGSVMLGPVQVVDRLESHYIQTTTGISTPPKSGIIV
jgi:hypothetical protein